MKYYYTENEESKSEMYGPLFNETLPFYLDKFEQIVSENSGYFVNGKVPMHILLYQFWLIINIFCKQFNENNGEIIYYISGAIVGVRETLAHFRIYYKVLFMNIRGGR